MKTPMPRSRAALLSFAAMAAFNAFALSAHADGPVLGIGGNWTHTEDDGAKGLEVEINTSKVKGQVVLQTGSAFLRIAGSTDLFPIDLEVSKMSLKASEEGAGAMTLGTRIRILSAEGQLLWQKATSDAGNSYIYLGPEVVERFVAIGVPKNEAFAGMFIGIVEAGIGFGGGVAHSDGENGSRTEKMYGPRGKIEGSLVYNIGCHYAPGVKLQVNGTKVTNMLCHGIRVQSRASYLEDLSGTGGKLSLHGAIGYQVGAPGYDANLYVQLESGATDFFRTADSSAPSEDNESGLVPYIGLGAGFNF
jgi:hypothetical protein